MKKNTPLMASVLVCVGMVALPAMAQQGQKVEPLPGDVISERPCADQHKSACGRVGQVASKYRFGYERAQSVAADKMFVLCEGCKADKLRKPLKAPIITVMAPTPLEKSEAKKMPPGQMKEPAQSSTNATAVQVAVKKQPSLSCEKCDRFVFFRIAKDAITDRESSQLNTMVNCLKQASDSGAYEIIVTGYTCKLGTQKRNDKLALARAKAVASWLEQRKIKVGQVKAVGKADYLSTDPEINRRVSIHLNRVEVSK
ncbi:MAG: Peptidoglycan-associated lipoprotein [Syntrophus sp. SKADARSKE-3]|nr:Peptidoglycan-associated lipoprotein [Syntrophus sp. SKADARSKE-3]